MGQRPDSRSTSRDQPNPRDPRGKRDHGKPHNDRRSRQNKRSRRDLADQRQHFLSALAAHEHRHNKTDHKTAMLCRQIQRALSLAFGGEIADPLLAQLIILDVQPLDGASHLLVEVALPNYASHSDSDFHSDSEAKAEVNDPRLDPHTSVLAEVVRRLSHARPAIRSIIASSITRKRVPELSFIPTLRGGDS